MILSNESTIEEELEVCSRAATARRHFGVAEIAVSYRSRARPIARLERAHNLGAQARCVGRALRAAKLERPPTKWSFQTHHDSAIGEVRPLLPPRFLAAWQAAVTHPASGRARLAALLPATLRLSGAHCLRFYGPSLLWVAMEAWLDHDSYVPISALFDYYARPGNWWISHEWIGRERDVMQEREHEELCLDHVDPVVSVLRRAGEELWRTVENSVKNRNPAWDVFDLEWVSDQNGRVVGDVAVRLPFDRGASDYTRQALPFAEAPLRAAIAAISFGRQPGSRHVAMHYAGGHVSAIVRPFTVRTAR